MSVEESESLLESKEHRLEILAVLFPFLKSLFSPGLEVLVLQLKEGLDAIRLLNLVPDLLLPTCLSLLDLLDMEALKVFPVLGPLLVVFLLHVFDSLLLL